jgi:hypothetical protein
MRQKILPALLIVSFGAVATTAVAQTAVRPATGSGTGELSAPSDPSVTTPMDASVPKDMRGYKGARAACDKQPIDSREKCWTTLNSRYSSLAPKCQKLSGSALDDCLKAADTGR